MRRIVWVALALSACGPPGHGRRCDRRHHNPKGAPPALELVHVDRQRSEMAWGALLMNQSDGDASWATVVDGCAEHIWWRPPSDPDARIFRAHLGLDGSRILYAEHSREHGPDLGWLFEVDIATDEVVRTTRIPEAHHDFAELPGEEVAWIGWQYLDNEWFEHLDADVVTDAIRVAPLGEQAATDDRLFSLYDDTGLQPWWTCNHMRPTDQIPGYAEWSHSNSLVWEPERDRLYLFARYWDALLAIDRQSGDLAWTLGGPRNAFEPVGETELLLHAHLSEVWDGGVLAFDNRNHDPDKVSRVVELAWDERLRTVEEVWSYQDGSFVSFLGDAQALPGGNVLITWSTDGRITEVTREGEVVWEARIADGGDKRLSRPEFHPAWPP